MADEMNNQASNQPSEKKGMDEHTKRILIIATAIVVGILVIGLIMVFVVRSQDPVSNSIRAIILKEQPSTTPTPTMVPEATPTPTEEPEATPTDEPEATPTPTEEPEATPTEEPEATQSPIEN